MTIMCTSNKSSIELWSLVPDTSRARKKGRVFGKLQLLILSNQNRISKLAAAMKTRGRSEEWQLCKAEWCDGSRLTGTRF